MRSGLPSISPREVSISIGGLTESVQRCHPLHFASIGDPAKHGSAPGVREGRQLVRDALPVRPGRAVAPELELLELPVAVLAQAEPSPDLVFVECHGSAPMPVPRAMHGYELSAKGNGPSAPGGSIPQARGGPLIGPLTRRDRALGGWTKAVTAAMFRET